MYSIVAGQDEGSHDLVVGDDLDGLPGHVSVWGASEVDTEVYAEGELTDAELLGLAAEEAHEAHRAGRVLDGPDEIAVRRVARRRLRRALTIASDREVAA